MRKPNKTKPRNTKASKAQPTSLAQQKLLAAGLGPSELARMTGASKSVSQGWLVDGARPDPKYQTILRRELNIVWADWDRRPTAPGEDEESGAPRPPTREELEALAPKTPDEDIDQDIAGLMDTLRRTLHSQQGASGSALATLLSNERALRTKLSELRDSRRTERQRLLSCPTLQGWYRVAAEILRPELGRKWPELVKRIGRAWDEVGEDGKLPEGFEL